MNPAQSLFGTWQKLWNIQKDLAKFFKADPHDLFLRANVTYTMNDFLTSIELPKNSEILVTDLEYGAITNICKLKAQRDDLKFRTIHLPARPGEIENLTPEDIVDAVRSQLSDDTSLLMMSHITTGTGIRLPIKEVAKVTREKGIVFAVDGAHGAGACPLDFSELADVEFYGTNLHKWLMGAKGTGFGWVNPRIKSRLKPTWGGWTSFEIPKPFMSFGEGQRWTTEWMITSTGNFSSLFAIPQALEFWNHVGAESIWALRSQLASALVETVEARTGWPCISKFTGELRGPMFTFELPPRLAQMDFDLMDLLRDQYRLQVAVTNVQGVWHLRLSPQIYNTFDEITRAAEILADVHKKYS